MTTVEEAKDFVKKYNIPGIVYFHKCPLCRSINISKFYKPPRYCLICWKGPCKGEYGDFHTYIFEQ